MKGSAMRSAALTRPAAPASRSLLARLTQILTLARSRRALKHLDDHLLRDIGLNRAEAEAEMRRPFWDAPSHWHD